MNEPKLTIDQLKNYLGTGLKLYMDYDEESYTDILTGLIDDYYFTKEGDGDDYHIRGVRPFMYRLSDLDKFIPELGFVPLDELYFEAGHSRDVQNKGGMMLWKKSNFEMLLYAISSEILFGVIQKLFQWHFWPFGDEYFEAGLVIDKLLYNPSTN